MEPIQKGLHFVKTNEIDDTSLEKLIQLFLIDISEYRCSIDEAEKEEPREEGIIPPSFEGGVVFTSNDKIIMTPQCCVSLQDHKEWSGIKSTDSFERIWLGHPWIYYKTQGKDILFTRLIEKTFDGKTWKHYLTSDNGELLDFSNCIKKTEKAIEEEDIKYRVNFQDMKKAIAGLQKELEIFQIRIEKIANKFDLVNPARVADCFVNGNGEMLSYNKEDAE